MSPSFVDTVEVGTTENTVLTERLRLVASWQACGATDRLAPSKVRFALRLLSSPDSARYVSSVVNGGYQHISIIRGVTTRTHGGRLPEQAAACGVDRNDRTGIASLRGLAIFIITSILFATGTLVARGFLPNSGGQKKTSGPTVQYLRQDLAILAECDGKGV